MGEYHGQYAAASKRKKGFLDWDFDVYLILHGLFQFWKKNQDLFFIIFLNNKSL